MAHKVFSIFMAMLVMFSTVSLTVEKHYCGDTLVDVAVFEEAKKCGMESSNMPVEEITKKSCCKDTVDLLEGQDELRVNSFDDLDYEQQLFVTTFVYSYINLFEGLPQLVVPHKDYSPPNLIVDIQVLDQVFLI
ncbi:hypothetical protein U0L90_05480 [Flavobacteriaceae sp. LMIT009]